MGVYPLQIDQENKLVHLSMCTWKKVIFYSPYVSSEYSKVRLVKATGLVV